MINPPRRLFLQWHGDANPAETGNLHGDNVSWCRDRVSSTALRMCAGILARRCK